MLAEESEEWVNLSPQNLNGTPVNLCLYVDDVDATFAQAIAAVDTSSKGVEDHFMVIVAEALPTLMVTNGRL